MTQTLCLETYSADSMRVESKILVMKARGSSNFSDKWFGVCLINDSVLLGIGLILNDVFK